MESLESLVMRLSEAALAGNINHQDHLPGELRELDLGQKYWGENLLLDQIVAFYLVS